MGLLFLLFVRLMSGIRLVNILIIVNIISNFYPCGVTHPSLSFAMPDGMRIIKLFYPQFEGLKDPFYITNVCILLYLIYCSI